MLNLTRLAASITVVATVLAAGSAFAQDYPLTIEHALGTTTIEAKPERIVTVNYANHEVPLALGVVPLGMEFSTWGDDNGNGIQPWSEERLAELGGETPVLFDESDGIDFEAVAALEPDVILAAYSGLDQQAYDTLSEIAPVVAYPESAWTTAWRDMVRLNSTGMGMQAEGEQLIADLEAKIAAAAAEHPELKGKPVMFITHLDTTDLSVIRFYTTADTRVQFFEDLGLTMPQSVIDASADGSFSGEISAENIDLFDDVAIVVTYGGQELIDALKADPLTSQMPAVANDAIVTLSNDPVGAAANPTPLAIGWVLDQYVDLLAEAAAKSE